jgi:transposase
VLVDTLGGLLAVVVLAADVSDRDGAALLLALYRARYPQLVKIWGDSHYGGDLKAEAQEDYGIDITVVSRAADVEGFVPLPKRWIVERTLSWLTHCRRLARDYERDPAYSEAWIHVASIHRLLKHLAPDLTVPVPYRRKAA